jgi:ABC-type lipoprotein export system ATPase subunit
MTGVSRQPGTAGETLTELEHAAAADTGSKNGFGAGAVIACDRLVRIYTVEGIEVQALQGLDLVIWPGELTALVGASGSGKSTLLNILSGLDRPTAGQVLVAGHDLLLMKGKERLAYRRQTVGFIWQQTGRNLLSYLTAAENVALPMRFAGTRRGLRQARAADLLELLGVARCADRYPAQMSGGEQQCVAIAVALANQPQVVLADEPTGELDTGTAAHVFAALRTANAESGVTVLVVTHDAAVSAHVQRTIAIQDGRTSTEVLRQHQAAGGGAADDPGGSAGTDGGEEFAVLDRAGRLQLPRDFTDVLGMRDRVRLALEADHIAVWPGAQIAAADSGGAGGDGHDGGSGQAGGASRSLGGGGQAGGAHDGSSLSGGAHDGSSLSGGAHDGGGDNDGGAHEGGGLAGGAHDGGGDNDGGTRRRGTHRRGAHGAPARRQEET